VSFWKSSYRLRSILGLAGRLRQITGAGKDRLYRTKKANKAKEPTQRLPQPPTIGRQERTVVETTLSIKKMAAREEQAGAARTSASLGGLRWKLLSVGGGGGGEECSANRGTKENLESKRRGVRHLRARVSSLGRCRQ